MQDPDCTGVRDAHLPLIHRPLELPLSNRQPRYSELHFISRHGQPHQCSWLRSDFGRSTSLQSHIMLSRGIPRGPVHAEFPRSQTMSAPNSASTGLEPRTRDNRQGAFSKHGRQAARDVRTTTATDPAGRRGSIHAGHPADANQWCFPSRAARPQQAPRRRDDSG